MRRHLLSAAAVLLVSGSLALCQLSAQTAPARPPAPTSAVDQLTPQMLGEMLRSATTFHDLVQRMDLNKSLGPDQHVEGMDGRLHHPMERTAQTIGAGVGAGVAIGAMTRSRNGVLIGALVGGAGGLIIDQILRHREDSRERAMYGPADDDYVPQDRPLEFSHRDQDQGSNAK